MMNSFCIRDKNVNVHGNYLLEASAGTGKTFAIENLVTRLLIEKNPETGKTLSIRQILVVTFTKAATADLKHRIRKNIVNCLKDIRRLHANSEEQYTGPFSFIENILNKGLQEVNTAIRSLEDALYFFDESCIYTIHGFCAKMLKEYIFEGDLCLSSDTEHLSLAETRRLVRNFFRTELIPERYAEAQVEIVLKNFLGKYEGLEEKIIRMILQGFEIKKNANYTELFSRFISAMEKLRSDFGFSGKYLREDFENYKDAYKKLKISGNFEEKIFSFFDLFDKSRYNNKDFDRLIEDDLLLYHFIKPGNKKVKKTLGGELHYPDLYEQVEAVLYPIIAEARSPEMIISNMANECREYLKKYCREEEKPVFDDYLLFMQKALENDQFRKKIGEKFCVAIIDEFQDTDLVQWKIFRTLFLESEKKENFLYLVGDPKQSIYSFRQADIYTYIAAAETPGMEQRVSLDTNYRSDPSLIRALNTLFSRCQQLIFLPATQQNLEYRPVKSGKPENTLNLDDGIGYLHFFVDKREVKRSNSYPLETMEEESFFPFMTEEILRLHNKEGFSFGKFAVLVSDRFQAERIGDFLKKRGVPFLVQKNSSLENSPALKALIEVLEAVLYPKNENIIKKALANPIIGMTDRIMREEIGSICITEDVMEKIYSLREILLKKNFGFFYEALTETIWNKKGRTIKEMLLLQSGQPEFFEELEQIAEILIKYQYENSAHAYGLIEFLYNFSEYFSENPSDIEKKQERNQNSVIIVTIHSCKGLEYDIVFTPGILRRSPQPSLIVPVKDPEGVSLKPVLLEEDEKYIQYCDEIDAEKMRQFYVAATRAKQRLYIPIAMVTNSIPKRGCASLLEIYLAKLQGIVKNSNELYLRMKNPSLSILESIVDEMPEITLQILQSTEITGENDFITIPESIGPAPEKIVLPVQHLFLQSFSSLSKKSAGSGVISIGEGAPQNFLENNKNLHTLPSGSETGNLLHAILENIPFDIENIHDYVKEYTLGTSYADWSECISEMINNCLHTSVGGILLKDISQKKMYREHRFLYPLTGNIPFLDEFIVSPGYLNGIIDLIFCANGKYYIVDWKSNWLGPDSSAYSEMNLEKSMDVHSYKLQAALYKEALKKYLSILVPDPFEEIYGGTYYFFLRGVESPGKGLYCVDDAERNLSEFHSVQPVVFENFSDAIPIKEEK